MDTNPVHTTGLRYQNLNSYTISLVLMVHGFYALFHFYFLHCYETWISQVHFDHHFPNHYYPMILSYTYNYQL